MTKFAWMCSLSLLFTPACGGPNPSVVPSGASTSRAEMAGTWKGNWSEETTEKTKLEGTAELSVDASGTVTGTMNNASLKLDGKVSGAVGEDGLFKGEFAYPNATLSGQGKVGVKGGKLIGAIEVKRGDQKVGTLSFELNR